MLDSGTYLLVIGLKKNVKIKIGKRFIVTFYRGYYIYAGSAVRNLRTRIERHYRKQNKKQFWHIDYFLNNEYTLIEEVITFKRESMSECRIAEHLSSIPGAAHPVRGFGASDCRNRCMSHLVYFKEYPNLYELKKNRTVFFTQQE